MTPLEHKALLSANKDKFAEILEKCLTNANLAITKVFGEAALKLFIAKLYENREKLFGIRSDQDNSGKEIKIALKQAVFEANIFKTLWPIAHRDETFQMTSKLVKTRIISKRLRAQSIEKENHEFECTTNK